VTAFLGALSLVNAWTIVRVPSMTFLVQAGNPAGDVDFIFRFLGISGGTIFIYVTGYLIYFSIAFRHRSTDPVNAIGVQIHDAPRLELWWTILPTILVLILGYFSVDVWYKLQNQQGDVLTVESIGYQYGFQYRYPKIKAPVPTLYLPVGTPVTLHTSVAADGVSHGFWLPEMRIKADMVPGLINTIRFTPTRIGDYRVVCTEFCGAGHGNMHGDLHVVSQQEFGKWFASAQSGGDYTPPLANAPAGTTGTGGTSGGASGGGASGTAIALSSGQVDAGQALFGQKCSTCHSVGPFTQKIVGPGLGHLFDDKDHPNLVTGKPVSPANIAMILKNGYQGDLGVMPSAQVNAISNTDIANLTAYLVSLSKK
jgi:cytochrome c oxidase subunit 2